MSNVFTDVSRKKVLDRGYDAALISFWCKVVAFFAYGAGIAALIGSGTALGLPDLGAKLHLSPPVAFLLYLLINTALEGTAILLNLRALQVSPILLCVPFMALTPLFLLPAGKFFLHESIAGGMVVGVSLVVIGSLVVNRQLFAHGLLEPVKAIYRERGSRYMTLVALLLTFTNVLDKWFVSSGGDAAFAVRLSRSFTLSMGKCIMHGLFFAGLAFWRLSRARKPDAAPARWGTVWREIPTWMVLAGVFEAVVLVLQLTAMQFTVAALVISIKRSGIVLAVFLGWLIFKERGITDRVIAACVMLSGVLVFFLTKPDAQGHATVGLTGALAVAVVALAGMGVALYMTHSKPVPEHAKPDLVEDVESEP